MASLLGLKESIRRLGPAWRRRLVFWCGALLIGGVSVLYADAADWAQAVFNRLIHHHRLLLPLLLAPIGFAACAWAGRLFPNSQGSGIPQAIAARQLPDSTARRRLLSLRGAVGKVGLTVVGLLSGASLGREGPTVQLGATIMLQVARFGRLGDEPGLILAGSAAGIAAAFNAPLAGIVFAIEEMSRSFEQRTNGLVLTAVILAGLVSLGVLGNYTYFGTTHAVIVTPRAWMLVPVCGVFGGIAGGLFSRALLWGAFNGRDWLTARTRLPPIAWPVLCGAVVGLVGVISSGASFGTGYAEARALVEGHPLPLPFWPAKFVATLATALSGIPGGIFAPSLAVGAGLGAWLAHLGGVDISLGAVLGMAGYFAGVTQAPMTAFVIILEMTGNSANVIPLMLTAVIGFTASRVICPEPLYHGLATMFLPKASDA